MSNSLLPIGGTCRSLQAAVPPQLSSQFVQLTTELVNCEYGRFQEITTELKKVYPLTERWLNWYLQVDRAKLIFKCCSMLGGKWNTAAGNTNAQEGTGKDIKFTATSTKLSMFEVVDHLRLYARNIQNDIGKLAAESKIRYKRKNTFYSPPQKKILNDGRPPATTVQLTSQTPYKLACIANIAANSPSCPDVPMKGDCIPMDTTDQQDKFAMVRNIQFLRNAYSSCYASSLLFILFHLFERGFVKLLLNMFYELPPNMKRLLDLFHLIRKKKFLQCRQRLMSYSWSHKDGALRGQMSSYTKFFHCYLENHPSLNFTMPEQVSIMVRVLKVNSEEKDNLPFGPMRHVATIQQCINNIVIWDSLDLVLVSHKQISK